MKTPNALVEFRIAQPDKVCLHTLCDVLTHDQSVENVHVEFTHKELFQFYEKVRLRMTDAGYLNPLL